MFYSFELTKLQVKLKTNKIEHPCRFSITRIRMPWPQSKFANKEKRQNMLPPLYFMISRSVLLWLLVFLLTIPCTLDAQPRARQLTPGNRQFTYRNYQLPGPRSELGLTAGYVFPFTDVAPRIHDTQPALTDIRLKSTDFNGSLFYRYRHNGMMAFKTTASYIKLKGDDLWSNNDTVRARNRSFSNNIFELALIGEFYIPQQRGNIVKNSWVDFVLFAGVAGVYHTPRVYGPTLDLYDYNQQRDPKTYRNFIMTFPTGIIAQYNYLNKWTIGLEMNFRLTFTDFLDGFNRPTRQRHDNFFTTNLSFSYVLNYSPRKANTTLFRKIFKPKRERDNFMGF